MDNQPSNENRPTTPTRPRALGPGLWVLVICAVLLALAYVSGPDRNRTEIPYGFFREELGKGNVTQLEVHYPNLLGEFKEIPANPEPEKEGAKAAKLTKKFLVVAPNSMSDELEKEVLAKLPAKQNFKYVDTAGASAMVSLGMFLLVTLIMVGVFWFMMRRARDQLMGGGFLSGFIKSPAKRYERGRQRTTFADVAGLESVKADLGEIVEFLKDPKRFQRLGARVPKGVLLMGPPGTGKTLLARAVAGEAGVPFFSINGSEFIQMFVGVGASRVRDLFQNARANSPCILFIDEIDAVGRVRGAGLGGGHDEREQTLNQILSEMDGFTATDAVIVLAATNRPDVLDPALLRPGRFDRHVTVDRPSRKARKDLFKVHVRDVPLADDVDFDRLANSTAGMTGADIQNLVNEAALLATRHDKSRVDMSDFEQARDKVLMGAKREEVLNDHEKEVTAYHESGHTIVAWLLPGNDRVHKVTVIPRGRGLGVTQLVPDEDRLNINETDLHARLAFILGGRAAEKLIYKQYSAGAESDLKQATQIARRMVTHWGMSERVGPVAYRSAEEHPFLGKEMAEVREHSEHTARLIDEEITRILQQADERARQVLSDNIDKVHRLTKRLIEKEELDEPEIIELIGPSVQPVESTNGKPKDEAKSLI